jgi:GT2 family glycosyltransferase
MLKTSIVIPNWNGRDKLIKNLPKVLKVEKVHEVIVVDDYSTDDSVRVMEERFPEVKLIKRSKNGGFSSAVNTGVAAATGDLVFSLNTDAVPSKDCVEKALKCFDDPQVFSVSCNVGGNWSWAKFENGYIWHYMASGDQPDQHQTLWSSGGSGIFRREVWNKLGGFDESFNPFYEEDTDLGYRATKRGYINLWRKDCHVEHYKEPGVISENFSKKTINETAQRNQLMLIWKNLTSDTLLRSHIWVLLKMLIAHPKYSRIFLRALIKLPKVLDARAAEKKHLKISDEQIFAKY